MARTPPAREPLSFAQQLDRLEEIVRRLEAQELDLDEALKLFEEGIERLREARERLTAAEGRSSRSSRTRPAISRSRISTANRALEAYLQDARARVDAALEAWGAQADVWWRAPLPAAIRYSLLSTGKRLRPTLVFASAEASGGGGKGGVAELAAAVEVVHAYSLVHDDLPCMDNDDLRRGRPTTHRAFDVGTATVAGYHMVALGARVLDAGMAALALEPSRRRAIALELFRAAGAGGMIGGQALDLEAEGLRLP